MIYECLKCKYLTENKTKFRRHLNTKKHRRFYETLKENETIPIDKEFNSAQFCSFSEQNDPKNPISAQFCSLFPKNIQKSPISAQFCSLFPKNIQKSPISTQFCSINKINNSININENENKNININEIIPEILTCDYCDYHTIRSGNFRRHINTCKNRKNEEVKYRLLYEKEKKGLIEQHEKEKQILYNQIDKLLEKVGNTTNHIQNNIILNNFGKEDLSHITNTFKTQLLKGPYGMIPKMIEAVHTKPENKNILLPNKKEPYVKVFENAEWKLRDRKETVKDLVDANYNRLDEFYEKDGIIVLNSTQKNRYKCFQNKYDNYDQDILERVIKDSELVLLNQPKKN